MKLIWIFEYTQIQPFGGALVGGCFGGLHGGFVGERTMLHDGFVVVTLKRGCSPVDLLHIFRGAFS